MARKRREEDKVLYKCNAIVLPQFYQTERLFRSHDQMGHQGINEGYQRILIRFEWPGMKKACEKWVIAVNPTGEGSQKIAISIAVNRVIRIQ